MKRCTQEHHAPGFGTIPVGSLWADDSPYAVEAECFEDVDAPAVDDEPVKPKRKPPTRKFGEKDGE